MAEITYIKRPASLGLQDLWFRLQIRVFMRIPSIKKCYDLMMEMDMLDHIIAHSIQVCRVADLLVNRLTDQGFTLNADLTRAAALLHDITKTKSFETGENHAMTGKKLLIDMGYPDVGVIVGQHVVLDEYFISDTPIEAEIVNYADKRVLHNKIAGIAERLKYVIERYGREAERRQRILTLWDKTERLENKIFSFLPFPPEAIAGLIGPDDCLTSFIPKP